MKFLRRLSKNGNSMMITLPPQVIAALRLRGGDNLIVEVPNLHTIVIRRAVTVEDVQAPAQPVTLDSTLPTQP